MTLVIYKEHRIEIVYAGERHNYYEIQSPNGITLDKGYRKGKKMELVDWCQERVDLLIEDPERFRDVEQSSDREG